MAVRRFLFLVIWFIDAWALFYTGRPLYFFVFALMALMLIISLLQLLLSILSLRLKTNLNPKTAEKNQPIGWKLLPRSTFFPIAYTGLSVRFPELGGDTEVKAHYTASPAFHNTDPVQVSIQSPYSGNFRLELNRVDFADVFGLWKISLPAKRFIARTTDIVYVLPDASLTLRAAMRYDDIVVPIRKTRERAEAVGVREYRSNDDFRSIHWKYSARIGKLHVKEYEKDAKDLHIVYVDLTDTKLIGEARYIARDYLLCAVMSFCEDLLREHIPVMIMAYSTQGSSQFLLSHMGRWRSARVFLSRQMFVEEVPPDFQTNVANYALREKATMTIFSLSVGIKSLSFLTQRSADFTSVALCLIPQDGYSNEQIALAHRVSDNGVYVVILPFTPPTSEKSDGSVS